MLPKKTTFVAAQCPNVSLIVVVRHSRVPRALKRISNDSELRIFSWVAQLFGKLQDAKDGCSDIVPLYLLVILSVLSILWAVAVLVSFLVLTKFLPFYTVGSDFWAISDDARYIGSTMPTRLYSTAVSGPFLSCSCSGFLLPPIPSWDSSSVAANMEHSPVYGCRQSKEAIQRSQPQLADVDASPVYPDLSALSPTPRFSCCSARFCPLCHAKVRERLAPAHALLDSGWLCREEGTWPSSNMSGYDSMSDSYSAEAA
ncbi:hypothetical protein B0H13DRAFT_2677104 [Mycena leptocephala]|nr:hypothetical protein B0H13DRAFT_2677104 [Mycena leptocephala]